MPAPVRVRVRRAPRRRARVAGRGGLGTALPSQPRCRPYPGSSAVSRPRSASTIPDTAPVRSSRSTAFDRNRGNAHAVGTPSRRGRGSSTAVPSERRASARPGGAWRPSGSNPQTPSSAGLRPSSRSSDADDSWPNTTPATSARHIARAGYSFRPRPRRASSADTTPSSGSWSRTNPSRRSSGSPSTSSQEKSTLRSVAMVVSPPRSGTGFSHGHPAQWRPPFPGFPHPSPPWGGNPGIRPPAAPPKAANQRSFRGERKTAPTANPLRRAALRTAQLPRVTA